MQNVLFCLCLLLILPSPNDIPPFQSRGFSLAASAFRSSPAHRPSSTMSVTLLIVLALAMIMLPGTSLASGSSMTDSIRSLKRHMLMSEKQHRYNSVVEKTISNLVVEHEDDIPHHMIERILAQAADLETMIAPGPYGGYGMYPPMYGMYPPMYGMYPPMYGMYPPASVRGSTYSGIRHKLLSEQQHRSTGVVEKAISDINEHEDHSAHDIIERILLQAAEMETMFSMTAPSPYGGYGGYGMYPPPMYGMYPPIYGMYPPVYGSYPAPSIW
eukprot:gene11492-34208_t